MATTFSSAPMIRRKSGANATPPMPNTTASASPIRMACAAARDAPSSSPSPIRRDTTAVTPMLSPIASV